METVAHGLWAAAAAITAKRSTGVPFRIGWAVWWGTFPDVLAFVPALAAGLWVRFTGDSSLGSTGSHVLPLVHLNLPLYEAGHSLIVFLAVLGVSTIMARRVPFALFGWLLHILIDIPTHSFSYFATRFLWPLSDYRVDGIPWWTPWFWGATYGALAVVYALLWRRRWISSAAPSPEVAAPPPAQSG